MKVVMTVLKFECTKYRCDRCNHEWVPRKDKLPIICPVCKSPYWNRKRGEIN